MATKRRERILDRDLRATRLVGQWRCMARYQLKEWVFSNVTDAMVSRYVERMTERGYLGAKRLHGIGVQLLWLTSKGRDFLVEHGVPDRELFPARSAVALKDLDHTLAIVSVGFALSTRYPAADALLPAWAVQRAFGGNLEAIPDVLCIDRLAGVLLACEVDEGGESQSLFAEKCGLLASWLATWSGDIHPAIVIHTSGDRRAATLRERLGSVLDPAIGLAVEVLPTGLTRDALVAFCGSFGVDLRASNRNPEPSIGDDGDGHVTP